MIREVDEHHKVTRDYRNELPVVEGPLTECTPGLLRSTDLVSIGYCRNVRGLGKSMVVFCV